MNTDAQQHALWALLESYQEVLARAFYCFLEVLLRFCFS